ncbi:hypothetical protein [Leptolyngbya sp. FACHB-261]|uniref:hypothetical protein n=1 Tax=Leptolyngbya sp. FACHB-261 TaxID=2692806 RepID=UPI001687F623|nr:hypothetical protein [Leptolyngbya sp. FACHB-261]MBD2099676.1 hypothetical protein [Leptolyngbya sp. FACHB-261]
MNRDSEALDRGLMAWLFGEESSPNTDGSFADLERNQRISQTWGELPAVQDRFQAILKRRLYVEIERNPPLFPWETELSDYTTPERSLEAVPDYASASAEEVASARALGFWASQVQRLELPVTLPKKVLAVLLAKAQTLIHSSMREGARLVRCVEDLFPDQNQQLNQIAGMVLQGASRDTEKLADAITREFSGSYEQAQPQQQMALSLLAAREILNNLSVSVRPGAPAVERQWPTDSGELVIQVSSAQPGQIEVEAQTPLAGALKLFVGEQEVDSAQRSRAGLLSVAATGGSAWILTVELQGAEPLSLALRLEA